MGRLNKKWKFIVTTAACFALMTATIPAAIWVTHTQTAELGNAQARCQNAEHTAHTVVIQNGVVSPLNTTAKRCDTLTITNLDATERLIAFGPHDHHISYDGVSERLVSQGQSLTVTLIGSGTFIFHDHTDPAVQGQFIVSN